MIMDVFVVLHTGTAPLRHTGALCLIRQTWHIYICGPNGDRWPNLPDSREPMIDILEPARASPSPYHLQCYVRGGQQTSWFTMEHRGVSLYRFFFTTLWPEVAE